MERGAFFVGRPSSGVPVWEIHAKTLRFLVRHPNIIVLFEEKEINNKIFIITLYFSIYVDTQKRF